MGEDMVGTVLATPLGTVLAMAMEAMVDTDSVMADMAMVVLAMAMARGLLMPSLTTDMVDTDLVLAMATASKQLSNGSYPDLPRLMRGTATTNICHILNFKLKILELCLLN